MLQETIKLMVESLKRQGLKENVDFRVVYFGISSEIKMIKPKKTFI